MSTCARPPDGVGRDPTALPRPGGACALRPWALQRLGQPDLRRTLRSGPGLWSRVLPLRDVEMSVSCLRSCEVQAPPPPPPLQNWLFIAPGCLPGQRVSPGRCTSSGCPGAPPGEAVAGSPVHRGAGGRLRSAEPGAAASPPPRRSDIFGCRWRLEGPGVPLAARCLEAAGHPRILQPAFPSSRAAAGGGCSGASLPPQSRFPLDPQTLAECLGTLCPGVTGFLVG